MRYGCNLRTADGNYGNWVIGVFTLLQIKYDALTWLKVLHST
jgi:hypothetical protein